MSGAGDAAYLWCRSRHTLLALSFCGNFQYVCCIEVMVGQAVAEDASTFVIWYAGCVQYGGYITKVEPIRRPLCETKRCPTHNHYTPNL
jgi:hypothetical protein